MEIVDDLSTHSKAGSVDLLKLYPNAHRSIVRRSWKFLLGYSAAVLLVVTRWLWMSVSAASTEVFTDLFDMVSFYVLIVGLLLCCLKLLYEEFFYASLYYELESGSIAIVSGVFEKKRISFPLSRVGDIQLERDFIDFLFALYDLRVTGPTINPEEDGVIRGFSRNTAVALQDFLTNVIVNARPQDAAALHDVDPVEIPETELG